MQLSSNGVWRASGGRRFIGLLATCLFAGQGHESRATDVVLTGDASAAEEYDTNLFRTLGPHKAAWGQGIDGRIDLSAVDQHWDSRLNARFANRWYVTDNNLDYYNQFFDWKNKYRTEYSLWNFNAQYNMDTTLSSETDTTVDVGYVFRRIPRTTRVLSPSWAYSLTENTLLNLSYDYQDRTYDRENIPVTNVVDSVSHTGGASVQHQWNPDLSLTASTYYADYTMRGRTGSFPGFIPIEIGGARFFLPGEFFTPAVDSTIKTASFMAGFNWAATNTVTLGFSGGAQYNQTDSPGYTATTLIGGTTSGPNIAFPGGSNDAVTEILSATARKRFEYSDIGFDYSRSVSPNLNGALVAYDRYSLSGNHRFSEHFSTNLTLSYSEQSSPTTPNSLTSVNREIFSARTGINWQWDENWMINTFYQFNQVSYPGSDAADSHGVFLNLKYLFDKHKL